MPEIRSKADLNWQVAGIMCLEPPLSERRAIHESGAWMWVPKKICWCDECRKVDHPEHDRAPHWEPADFCCDPSASYRLEQWVRLQGFFLTSRDVMAEETDGAFALYCDVTVNSDHNSIATEGHHSRLIALCLAVCSAHNLELEFSEGWDQR